MQVYILPWNGIACFRRWYYEHPNYTETLEQHLEPSFHRWFSFDHWTLQGNIASVHKSVQSHTWKRYKQYQIRCGRHGHQYLSPIENWCLVLNNKVFFISTKEELTHELQVAWNELPLWYIRRHSDSILRPVRMVLHHEDHLTRYLTIITLTRR